jgi:hypothetical protein
VPPSIRAAENDRYYQTICFMSARLPIKRRPVGAPSKRTPDVADRICLAVSKGVPFCHAARLSGISYSMLCDWRNTDPEFSERLDAAISEGVEKRLKMIQDAADGGDWRAAEVWLRLVLPSEYGRQRLELTGANGSPLAGTVAIVLPQKVDNGPPVVTVPALEERTNANGD